MSFHPTYQRPTEYGMNRDELNEGKDCRRAHRDHWVVLMRHGNVSAFNGYHFTPSDYSKLRCTLCGRIWRTKANYVRHLPDVREDE